MRICLDIRFEVESGASTTIRQLAPLLVAKGRDYEFVVITHGQVPLSPSEHLRIHEVPFRPPFKEFLWTQTVLPSLLKKWRVDLYHSLKLLPPMYTGTKVIYRAGSVGYYTGDYPSTFAEHLYWRSFARRILRRVDRVTVGSEQNRDVYVEVVGLGPKHVTVINNGVAPMFTPLAKDDAREHLSRTHGLSRDFLLCVGNLFPVKNYATVIDAYQILCGDRPPDYDLVMIGRDDHPYAVRLKETVRRRGLASHVRFLGLLPTDVLPRFYNAALCLVQPSLHEGFCNTVVEAMSCGLPVICSRRGALENTCGDVPLYLDEPTDAGQLAHLVGMLLESNGVRQRCSEAGLRRARRYRWDAAADKTLAEYRDVLGEG